MVFCDNDCPASEQLVRMLSKQMQHVNVVVLIRRIEEDNVRWRKIARNSLPQEIISLVINYRSLIFWHLTQIKIRFNETAHLSRAIDKGCVCGTSGYRFDSHCT